MEQGQPDFLQSDQAELEKVKELLDSPARNGKIVAHPIIHDGHWPDRSSRRHNSIRYRHGFGDCVGVLDRAWNRFGR